ncbi:hypothetical protein GCM10010992_19440 [Cloacibacterium rupense]|uniref:Outer membrane protein beta-barrel domain-containing protein n=1 Tax=Cloacibacterium rupense TaxID=517423 RepID=A0ABQ2NJK1_9FLAO|nr:porin family protein [Cloacibacterium rupense]GGP04997.1 hypothetical protein GCM10010992_19440 [Cloacibacterium rupense]
MKNSVKKSALVLSILAYYLGFAQIDFSSTRFGVTAGPTYSRVQNAHNPSSARVNFFAGAFAIIPIGGDDMFYLQPGVEYLGAGENGQGSAKYGSNYISVPLYFKAYFSEAESEFFGQLGPRFGFLLSQSIKNPTKSIYNEQEYGKAAGFDFAVSAGLGFSFKRKLEIFTRFDYGITDNLPDLKGKEPFDASSFKTKKQHVLSAGISYIFD